jgi:hypothetical protein
MVVCREGLSYKAAAITAGKLAFYGALMYALLMMFAAVDHFLFGDGWNGWTRVTAYVVSFALPALLLAWFFQAPWVGFLAGACLFVTFLLGTLLTADLGMFIESYFTSGNLRWLPVSPFLSPVWGAVAGNLLRRAALRPL